MGLKKEEKDKIKEFLLKTISIGENPYKAMENNFKISRQTVSKYLNELVEKNYITKNSKGNYAINFYTYFINPLDILKRGIRPLWLFLVLPLSLVV